MAIVLGLNDPWHDSNFCVYSRDGILHVEMERFTRSKYEQLNPIIGLAELYPNLIETIDIVAIEEGEFLAPYVRALIATGESGINEFVSQIMDQTIGSIQLGRSAKKN